MVSVFIALIYRKGAQLQSKLDTEFRKQLLSQRQSYEEQLDILRHERDIYIANANRKVIFKSNIELYQHRNSVVMVIPIYIYFAFIGAVKR